jgi:glutamate 5-kinase
VAVGLINYGAKEAARIMGKSSDRIAGILGYMDEAELMHRDNMAIL